MNRNDSSFAPNSRRISLSALLRAPDSPHLPTIGIPTGAYIQVKVLWRSELPRNATVCNLILADDENHISAIVFSIGYDINAKNVCEKLRPSTSWRITNFQMSTIGLTGSDRNLLQTQNKRLQLSCSTCDILPIPAHEEQFAAFVTYIPFRFVGFEDIDTVPDTNWIDLIGFAENLENKTSLNGLQYKLLRVRPFRADEGIRKDIAIFGEGHMNSMKKKNVVYALLNVEVSTFNNQKSLKFGPKTAVFEVKSNDVETILQPEYQQGEFVKRLFPRRRSSIRARAPAAAAAPPAVSAPIAVPVPSAAAILEAALNR